MLLWGDRLDQQARGSLRNAVAAIRSALGRDVLTAERDTLALVPGSLMTDVDRLAAAGPDSIPDDELDAMLRSQFLDGIGSPSEAVDDWLAFERARCRVLAQSTAQKTIAAHEQAGRVDEDIRRFVRAQRGELTWAHKSGHPFAGAARHRPLRD